MEIYQNEVITPDDRLFRKLLKILETVKEIYAGKIDNVSFVYNICVRFFKDSKLKGNWWSKEGKLQSYWKFNLDPTKEKICSESPIY